MSTFNANRVNGLSNAMSNYMENKKAVVIGDYHWYKVSLN